MPEQAPVVTVLSWSRTVVSVRWTPVPHALAYRVQLGWVETLPAEPCDASAGGVGRCHLLDVNNVTAPQWTQVRCRLPYSLPLLPLLLRVSDQRPKATRTRAGGAAGAQRVVGAGERSGRHGWRGPCERRSDSGTRPHAAAAGCTITRAHSARCHVVHGDRGMERSTGQWRRHLELPGCSHAADARSRAKRTDAERAHALGFHASVGPARRAASSAPPLPAAGSRLSPAGERPSLRAVPAALSLG